MNHEN